MLLLTLLLQPALATTLVVCGGWTTTDCYSTIQEAVDASVDGDVIWLGGGSFGDYEEAVTISDKTLSIMGDEGYVLWMSPDGEPALSIFNSEVDIDAVAFRGDTYRLFTIDASSVRISNAHIWGATQSDAGAVGVAFDSSLWLTDVVVDGGWSYNVGGHLWLYRSNLYIDRCTFRGGFAQLGGGSIWDYGYDFEVTNSTFQGNTTGGQAGAIEFSTGGHTTTPLLRGNRFEGNSGSRGALALGSFGGFDVEDNVFVDNYGYYSSALGVRAGSANIVRNLFCVNTVQDGVTDAGALTVSTSRSLLVANNEFVENENGALAIEGVVDGFVRNNHFVGNIGPEDPVIALVNGETVSAVRVAYNVVTHNLAGFGATPSHSESGYDTFDHNLWWGNQPEMPAEVDLDGLFANPLLDDYVADGRCSMARDVYDRDELWMPYQSPIRDVETSTARPDDGVDLDGSPLDIGAFGGPHARATPDWDDPDEDGSPSLFDCDPVNVDIFPGAGEVVYDGIDQNCDFASDFDADEDGQDAEFWGGFDCNDHDPTVYLSAEEIPYDGVDQNCDGDDLNDVDGDGFPIGLDCDDSDPTINPGEVDDDARVDRNCDGYLDPSAGLEPVGCSTVPGNPSFLLALLALGARRRRATRDQRPIPSNSHTDPWL
jgi:hypothetical protein